MDSDVEGDMRSDVPTDDLEKDIKISGSESSFSEHTGADPEETEDEELTPNREWQEVNTSGTPSPPPPRFNFEGNSSVNFEVDPNCRVQQSFCFFDDQTIKFITDKTNREFYTPERDVTVDESLLLYKGGLGLRQYIPHKRARFGIKTFVLCESSTGYIWSKIAYTGKGTALDRL
ncbi:hypothetical protein J437_LFUL016630 [Ladona fulva]|uniref:PiggyBac transposable element-derived protein domain-containing protein n=1 Tax=Ladona fulva TaxID=123851 RepID=A0A8K0P7Y2_LADFU|nr:hypothetical protein J437_LFUL016630 [Ladona fulva]